MVTYKAGCLIKQVICLHVCVFSVSERLSHNAVESRDQQNQSSSNSSPLL